MNNILKATVVIFSSINTCSAKTWNTYTDGPTFSLEWSPFNEGYRVEVTAKNNETFDLMWTNDLSVTQDNYDITKFIPTTTNSTLNED